MRPLQRLRPLLLLALLALCMFLCQAQDEKQLPKETPRTNATTSASLNPPCGSPPLLSLALGVVAAFLMHLR